MKLIASVLICSVSLLSVCSADLKVGSVRVGYYSEWSSSWYTPSHVDYSKLTHINYAFVDFDAKTNLPKINNADNLKQVVRAAHGQGCKVLISIGGWSQSKNFSPMVAKKESRAQFINNFVNLMNNYSLDGIDFDWEYPGMANGDNKFDLANDTKNFLTFLTELRAKVSNSKLITAAAPVAPFIDQNGPIRDARGFANLFDFINVMTYDFVGSWSKASGPLGGLDFEAGKGVQLSVKSALRNWESSGFPKNKLVVGVPFYAYGWQIKSDGPVSTQYNQVAEKLETLSFGELHSKNILKSPLEANTEAGWVRNFDKVTNTPWVYNKNTKALYVYDDTKSLKIKSNYAKCNGYLGTMIWALPQDYNGTLLNAVQGDVNAEICKDITKEHEPEVTPTSSQVSKSTSASSSTVSPISTSVSVSSKIDSITLTDSKLAPTKVSTTVILSPTSTSNGYPVEEPNSSSTIDVYTSTKVSTTVILPTTTTSHGNNNGYPVKRPNVCKKAK